jgi:hypothetical protein
MALHLTAACRQISLELGKNFVFRSNTFMVNSYFAPWKFTLRELVARLGKDQRNSIEVLGLNNYDRFSKYPLGCLSRKFQDVFKDVNQFRNLKRLVVTIESRPSEARLKEWTANEIKERSGKDGLVVEFVRSFPRCSC